MVGSENRQQRRNIRKMERNKHKAVFQKQEIVSEKVLMASEDELAVWQSTLTGYQTIAKYAQYNLRLAIIFNTTKVDDGLVRDLLHPAREITPQLMTDVTNSVKQKNWGMVNEISRNINELRKFQTYYSNEDFHQIWDLFNDQEIRPIDIIKELYRYSVSMRDLTMMHVRWLEEKDKPKKTKKPKQVKKNTPSLAKQSPKTAFKDGVDEVSNLDDIKDTSSDISIDKPDEVPIFGLRGTSLFVTENPWRTDEQYLGAIRTDLKVEAIEDVARLCRGVVSIKPVSVINALEFYLGKGVFEKAMSARLRYVDDDKKDWVKIKRGKDRIMVKEEKDENGQSRMVFFVEGRDQVYRNLPR